MRGLLGPRTTAPRDDVKSEPLAAQPADNRVADILSAVTAVKDFKDIGLAVLPGIGSSGEDSKRALVSKAAEWLLNAELAVEKGISPDVRAGLEVAAPVSSILLRLPVFSKLVSGYEAAKAMGLVSTSVLSVIKENPDELTNLVKQLSAAFLGKE